MYVYIMFVIPRKCDYLDTTSFTLCQNKSVLNIQN